MSWFYLRLHCIGHFSCLSVKLLILLSSILFFDGLFSIFFLLFTYFALHNLLKIMTFAIFLKSQYKFLLLDIECTMNCCYICKELDLLDLLKFRADGLGLMHGIVDSVSEGDTAWKLEILLYRSYHSCSRSS